MKIKRQGEQEKPASSVVAMPFRLSQWALDSGNYESTCPKSRPSDFDPFRRSKTGDLSNRSFVVAQRLPILAMWADGALCRQAPIRQPVP